MVKLKKAMENTMGEKFELREYLDQEINSFLQNEKFYKYYEFLISENKKYNLTRITEINDVYYKHFYDSLYINKVVDLKNKSILDVGAGAGFPSVPLSIINKDIEITIIDSLRKRINFLKGLIEILAVDNITLINGRAEELEKKHLYDVVTARAVAKLNILAEITIPYVKKGGFFIAMKSLNFEDELKEASEAIKKLGGKIIETITYSISEDEKHTLIIIKKIEDTPSIYPRHFSKIKKSPL